MKKIITIMSILFCLLLNLNMVSASSSIYKDELALYVKEIEKINLKYNTNYYILNENEYQNSMLSEIVGSDYQNYINLITSQSIIDFREALIKEAQYINMDKLEIKLDSMRSTYGSKTLAFFNGYNKMTLKYKYSGSTFDTSYKPTVTVSRVSNMMFFEMSSYVGKFLNSNKTYSVTASGRIITTTGIANNKSFTVNFNL